jgi:hypothetical protein
MMNFVYFLTIIALLTIIVLMLYAIYSWAMMEPAFTREELEWAEYRSLSWPSKPGQDPFTAELPRPTSK